jgi:hypothetical protein
MIWHEQMRLWLTCYWTELDNQAGKGDGVGGKRGRRELSADRFGPARQTDNSLRPLFTPAYGSSSFRELR